MNLLILKIKQLTILFALLLFSFQADAQLWQHEITPPFSLPPPGFEFSTKGYDIQQSSDGNYIFAGRFKSGISPNFTYEPVLSKLDAVTGNELWTRSYSIFMNSYSLQEVSVVEKPNGNILLAGLEGNSIFLIEFDDAGDTISTTKITSTCEAMGGSYCQSQTIRLRATPDGNYIIGIGSSGGMIGIPNPQNQLIKIDANNAILWNKTYNNRVLLDFQPTNDGGYIMSGTNNVSTPLLFKVDMNGDSIWQQEYNGQLMQNLNSVVQTPDNGYVVAFDISGFAGYSPFLMKVDSSGANILWQISVSNHTGNSQQVSLDMNGNYVVTGTQSMPHGGMLTIMVDAAFVTKVSPNGAILQTQFFDNFVNNSGTVVRPTSDGNFIMVGSHKSTVGNGDNGYVVKTGYWLSTEKLQTTKNNLSIFPNPFSTNTTISLDDVYQDITVSVFDALGREVQVVSAQNSNQVVVQKTNLDAGIYFVKVVGDKQLVGSGKLLIR